MRNYYKSTREELYTERLMLKSEMERVDHALSFMEVAEYNMKEMLWNRYEEFKKEKNLILIVKYTGGNSCDPKMYKYYEAKEIKDKIYETEINQDHLFWLNNNRQYLDVVFNWL